MSTGIWSAASGAVAQSASLDVSANNIANASTPGYRADRSVFQRTMSRAMSGLESRSMTYAIVRSAEPDFRQGAMVQTGRPLDVALGDPAAFFVVRTPAGERYTRAGNLAVQADGSVTTKEGLAYLGPDRKALKVDPSATKVEISPEGALVVDDEEGTQRLLAVTFSNPRGLEKEGDVLLRARPEAGRPEVTRASVMTETLEMSNQHAVKSMSGLVQTTRTFDMLARVIEAFSKIDTRAAQDIAKKGS